jgi:hypothetical protein
MNIRETIVITRVPHRCWGCGDLYPPRSRMTEAVSVDMGKIGSTYWCDRCDYFIKYLPMDDQIDLSMGIPFAGMREYEKYPKQENVQLRKVVKRSYKLGRSRQRAFSVLDKD